MWRRYVVAALLSLGLASLYALHKTLILSLPELVRRADPANFTTVCTNRTSSHRGHGPLLVSRLQHLLLLNLPELTALLAMLPAALLALRFGAARILALSVGLCVILGLPVPSTAEWGFPALLSLFVCGAAAAGMAGAAAVSVVGGWSCREAVTLLAAVALCGPPLGLLLAEACLHLPWPYRVYALCGAAAAWLPAWLCVGGDGPLSSSPIGPRDVPWRQMLGDRAVWAVVGAVAAARLCLREVEVGMPFFMARVLGAGNPFPVSLWPPLALIAGRLAAARLADFLIARDILGRAETRKLLTGVGLLATAVCLLLITEVGCSLNTDVALHALTVLFSAALVAGPQTNVYDISPALAGLLIGLAEALTFVGRLVAVAVVAAVGEGTTRWHVVFYVDAAAAVVGGLGFIVGGGAQERRWEEQEDEEPMSVQQRVVSVAERVASVAERRISFIYEPSSSSTRRSSLRNSMVP